MSYKGQRHGRQPHVGALRVLMRENSCTAGGRAPLQDRAAANGVTMEELAATIVAIDRGCTSDDLEFPQFLVPLACARLKPVPRCSTNSPLRMIACYSTS
jgi:hypothetical protein